VRYTQKKGQVTALFHFSLERIMEICYDVWQNEAVPGAAAWKSDLRILTREAAS